MLLKLPREVALLALSFLRFSYAHVSSSPLAARDYDLDEIQVDASRHEVEFFTFVTRPDLDAPRLNVKVYNESATAPGYLFLSPYGIVQQTDHDKAYVGPHIYDAAGNLVWSGVDYFDGYDTFDFRVASVGDRDMLTAIHPHGDHSVILDNTYEMYADVPTGHNGKTLNMHVFAVVDNGTRALYLTRDLKRASMRSSEAVQSPVRCHVEFTGFEERDIDSGKVTFTWTPENRIGLEESTLYRKGIPQACSNPDHPWDYLHMNSIQKLDDGDYLTSGRRSSALYKISHETGDILWRFGGKKSDFDFEGHFSGQHDAQCHFQNSTHMLVSMMDNASGPGYPKTTNDFSRGLIVWLDTVNMKAHQVKTFDHPYKEYASARGNFQTLPNDNAFLSWEKRALQSEHTPDGKMVMEASFPSGLKTYRAFKFPWVGRPSSPPDVHSQTVEVDDDLITAVHVSWNGDTEVAYWNLYKTNADGSVVEPVTSAKRYGFETALTYGGAASFVLVEGLDAEGERIGLSEVVPTIGWSKYKLHPAAVKEQQWIEQNPVDPDAHTPPGLYGPLGSTSLFFDPVFTFFCGIFFVLAMLLAIFFVWRLRRRDTRISWRRSPLYTGLLGESEDEKEDANLLGRRSRSRASSGSRVKG